MLNPEYPLLWIDASAHTLCAGVLRDNRWLAFAAAEHGAPALESLTPCVRTVLVDAGMDLDAIQGFIHCEGPGSVLGIRVAAAAIETWRSLPAHRDKAVFGYRGLELAAWILARRAGTPESFSLITESRMKRVNVFHSATGGLEEIGEAGISGLPGRLYHLPQRRSPPPALAEMGKCVIAWRDEADAFAASGLPRKTAHPNVYTPAGPAYKKWTGKRHTG